MTAKDRVVRSCRTIWIDPDASWIHRSPLKQVAKISFLEQRNEARSLHCRSGQEFRGVCHWAFYVVPTLNLPWLATAEMIDEAQCFALHMPSF
jgi:hypothetical protein